MNATEILWRWLVHSALLSGVVLVAGVLAVRFVRAPADRLRLIVWVLAGCLAAPCLPGLSGWRTIALPLMESPRTASEVDAGIVPATVVQQVDAGGPIPDRFVAAPMQADESAATSPAIVTPVSVSTSFADVAVGVYLVAMVALLLWWMAGLWRRFALGRSATVAGNELQAVFDRMATPGRRRVRLLDSGRLQSPLTWGLVHPVIVVPARFASNVDDPQLRWSLAHELSHVERYDVGTLLLARLVQLVCWYQPLVWWLNRQLVLCQDYIADARAARETELVEDYAAFLVRLARERLQPALPATLGIGDRPSRLFRRVRMLVDATVQVRPRCTRTTAIASATGAALLLVALSTIRLDAEDGPKATPATDNAKKPASNEALAIDPERLEAGVVTGILVRASDGSPVADATVILHAGGSNKTKTDAEGRFRLEKIRPRARPYPVWGHLGNLVTPKIEVKSLPNADPTVAKFAPVRLEMTEGKQARFVVTSEATGKPIEGASVRFGYPDRRHQTTDASGSTTVPGLLPEIYSVIVEAEGMARNAPEIDLSRTGGVMEYQAALEPGGVVRGVAVDADGKPVPEAEVSYYIGSATGFGGDAFRTDAEGRFRHRFLPLNQSVRVWVRRDGYERSEQEFSLTSDQRTRDLRVVLKKEPPGGSIAGMVVDTQGKPIRGAVVTNHGNTPQPHQQTTTDAEGRFVLHDLAKSYVGYEIRVAAEDYAPELIEVKPGSVETPGNVTVTLEPGHTLRGRIVTEDGLPAKGATIAVRSGVYVSELGETITTGDSGEFFLKSLPGEIRLDVGLKGYASRHSAPVTLDGADPVTITLERPGIILGRVTDAESRKPVPQFRIRLGFSKDRQPDDAWGTYSSKWSDPGVTFESKTGEFVIEELAQRFPVEMIVEADGYRRLVIPRAVALKTDDAAPLELALKRLDPGALGILSGRMLDHAGQPAAGVQLRLIATTAPPTGPDDNAYNWVLIQSGQLGQKSYVEQYLSATTGAEGRFEFKELRPGLSLQLAYWGKHVPQGRWLGTGKTATGVTDEMVIRLPKPATIRGTIDRAKFPDAGSVRANLRSASFQDTEFPLKEGQKDFELNNLPPGEYFISVASRPVRFVENGNTFFRISSLAHKRLVVEEGQSYEIEFLEPDSPRP